jgi:hypothetical protein
MEESTHEEIRIIDAGEGYLAWAQDGFYVASELVHETTVQGELGEMEQDFLME